uniref:Protein E6 n=1 Tax=Human papillomavirus TaxID=10566 RepID=A0A385PLE5_9PAPI|nr:MAG: E6 protein [Human papillomavirus]
MAGLCPTRLDEYCIKYQLPFFNLELPCIFCKRIIDLQSLAAFYVKDLSLVWKDDACYACCQPCLKLTARYERERYTRCIVKAYSLQFLLQLPLSAISVRCVICYKPLDTAEKFDCYTADYDFWLIRYHWRSYCRFCAPK